MAGAIWALGDIWQANIYIQRSPEYVTTSNGVIECLTAGVFCVIIGITSIILKDYRKETG